jgi:cell division protein FtsL
MRLEPQGQVAYHQTASSFRQRDRSQSARPLGQVARGGTGLGECAVATAAKPRVRGLRSENKAQVKRADRRRRQRHLMVFVFSALGLSGVALLHVWLRLQVVHMGYVLATTSKLQSQLEQENRELKVELATLTSPDRLEALSRRRLGLRPPEKGQVIVLP